MEINLKSIKIGFLGSITGTFMSISSILPPSDVNLVQIVSVELIWDKLVSWISFGKPI